MRTGMTEIVANLRLQGQAAVDDEFDGVVYWTDDQLQSIADNRSVSKRDTVNLRYATIGSLRLFSIDIAPHDWIETDTITVYDDLDNVVATAFTFDPVKGELLFEADLPTSRKYKIEVFRVNMIKALAELWEQKAAQRFDFVDMKTGNNKVSMKQEYDTCVERARYWRNKIVKRFSRSGLRQWGT